MYEYQATVERIIDGDTIEVTIDLGFSIKWSTPVRLFGINAAETNSKVTAEREQAQLAKSSKSAHVSLKNGSVASRLLWISGARPGEIVALTPAELQQDGKFLVYRPKSHKTKRYNKLRAVVFGPECEAILRKYWPPAPSVRFFGCYSDSAVVRNAIYRACERGKLPRWHTYQLRHAAVTRIALEHGKEVATAVAGHANCLTTERYDHGAIERAKRAAG